MNKDVKNEWFWLFRDKESGCVDISRHSRPDFVQGLSQKEIRTAYDRVIVNFPINKFDWEAQSIEKEEAGE